MGLHFDFPLRPVERDAAPFDWEREGVLDETEAVGDGAVSGAARSFLPGEPERASASSSTPLNDRLRAVDPGLALMAVTMDVAYGLLKPGKASLR